MCATVSWGAHESFMHPIFVLKIGCDSQPLGRACQLLWEQTIGGVFFMERRSMLWRINTTRLTDGVYLLSEMFIPDSMSSNQMPTRDICPPTRTIPSQNLGTHDHPTLPVSLSPNKMQPKSQ
jgi:hypothetical protein